MLIFMNWQLVNKLRIWSHKWKTKRNIQLDNSKILFKNYIINKKRINTITMNTLKSINNFGMLKIFTFLQAKQEVKNSTKNTNSTRTLLRWFIDNLMKTTLTLGIAFLVLLRKQFKILIFKKIYFYRSVIIDLKF